MRKHTHSWRTLSCAGLLSLCLVQSVSAFTTEEIYSPTSGTPVFSAYLYQAGEADKNLGEVAFRDFNTAEVKSIRSALQYWTGVIDTGVNAEHPATIRFLSMGEIGDNAGTLNHFLSNGTATTTAALFANQFGETGQEYDLSLAEIVIAQGPWFVSEMTNLPSNGRYSDLCVTLVHEMGHALGLGIFPNGTKSFEEKYIAFLPNKYTNGLYILVNGQETAVPHDGTTLIIGEGQEAEAKATGKNYFVLRGDMEYAGKLGEKAYTGLYFTGKNVQEVLGEGTLLSYASDPDNTRLVAGQKIAPVPGIPLLAWEGRADFSHIELQNAFMSHQDYRNWNIFMEAELAMLQDLGNNFDRKQAYGFSIYKSGTADARNVVISTNPYFARNSEGWIEGQASTVPYGIGLHIYGSFNDVTQGADLLADGKYGIGIRVDGEANNLSIPKGTTVHANGKDGNAVLVAYGRNHRLAVQGELTATGEGGIGARFDFGDNSLGNIVEYRGSYIRTVEDNPSTGLKDEMYATLPEEIKGPLVKSFDLTGILRGSQAAISIGPSALVSKINIMSGAYLEGDIVSTWNTKEQYIQYTGPTKDLITHLSFGLQADANGFATEEADASFALRYDGNISASQSMVLEVKGGELSLNGTISVLGVVVDTGATLKGNGTFSLHELEGIDEASLFMNAGTLAPGNSIGKMTINGNYSQAASGRIEQEFDATGNADQILVSDTARLAGVLTLIPLQDYYPSSSLTLPAPVSATKLEGSFATEEVRCSSPTLSMALTKNEDGTYTVAVHRDDSAYSQYAKSDNAANVGHNIAAFAKNAPEHLKPLIVSLDFSSPDGTEIRSALSQLSPDAYGNVVLASLDKQRVYSDLLLSGTQLRAEEAKKTTEAQWQIFVQPFAASMHQGRSGASGYASSSVGGIAGVEWAANGSSFGAHLSVSHDSLHGDTNGQGTNDSLHLGLQAALSPESWAGWNVFGAARLGIESIRMTRDLSFGSYRGQTDAKYTAQSGSMRLGAGWKTEIVPQWTAGLFAELDYAFFSMPDFSEAGDNARLHIDGATFQSLRSGIGPRLSTKGEKWTGSLQAMWHHELLAKAGEFDARFAGGEEKFVNKVKCEGRDSLGLNAKLVLHPREDISVGLDLGAELLRSRSTYGYGQLSLSWTF